jgi:putative CocE/NonD family hydrolase
MPRHPHRLVVLVRLLALLATGLVTGLGGPATASGSSGLPGLPGSSGPTTSYTYIPGSDGTLLSALVVTPSGTGPFPLVVMPSSWGVDALEYYTPAQHLAADGYEVVSYTSRGFYDSGGVIDIAGPDTQKDVSAVIDWALKNTPSDPSRIGAAGISYGAGLSLLAAERDPRIKAVAALSGWGSIADSTDTNHTLSQEAMLFLAAAAETVGRAGPDLQRLLLEYSTQQYATLKADLARLSPVRSPITDVTALNAHHTAVLMANGFEDGIFPPNQYVRLFRAITGPKRLELEAGDHATPESSGLTGGDNVVFANVYKWFDHFLKGADNGITSDGTVHLKDVVTGRWRSYPTWRAVVDRRRSFQLTGTGRLRPKRATGWSTAVTTGVPTTAQSGVVLASGALASYGAPPTVPIDTVSTQAAGVWQSGPLARRARIGGVPVLRTTVRSTSPMTPLISYLYDVDASGTAKLVDWKPWTIAGSDPQTLKIRMDAISWTVPAGHHLAVVVNTVDPRYTVETTPGDSLTFSSPTSSPSYLSVPLTR